MQNNRRHADRKAEMTREEHIQPQEINAGGQTASRTRREKRLVGNNSTV